MSYEMNFEMYVSKKEQRLEVLKVIQKTLSQKGYENFAHNFTADEKEQCVITENTGFSFSANSFNDAIYAIYEAIIRELPDIDFKGFSGYTWGTLEAGHCFEKKNNSLFVNKITFDGCGHCPECGEMIVDIENYDPENTYICPECGEIIPNEELFSLYQKEENIYEIIDGILITE